MPPELNEHTGQASDSPTAVLEPPQPDNVSSAVVSPPPIVSAPPPEPTGTEPSGTDSEQTHTLRTSEFKSVKEKANAKGREAERVALNTRAKELGFTSVEQLFAEMALRQAEPELIEDEPEEEESTMATPTKKKPVKRQRTPAADNRLQRKLEMSEKARKEGVRKWRASEKRRREAQRQLAAKEAEMELREVAIQSGIKDVDYSIRLLTRHLSGKSEDQLAEFDESSFFTGLREERPYLFGENVMPANTGTTPAAGSTGDEPVAPGADQTQQLEAESSQFDARKATAEEVQARFKQLGLRQPLI